MKTKTSLILLLFSLLMSFAPPVSAQTVSSNVSVQVKAKTNDEKKDIPGSTDSTTIDKHTLQITLRGRTIDSEKRVAKWYVFGRNLKTKEVSVLGSGEVKVSFPANGTQTFESKEVTSTFTPDHVVGSGSGKRKKYKKVDAEGVKIIGYGAQVKDGDKIVGEFFSAPSLKESIR